MENLTDIQQFYKGRTVFITGGSGLMGKVLIEKLLYSCSDLEKIYMLIRSKKGRTPENRVDDMFKLPMFQRIRKETPEMMKKVVPLSGDVASPYLGLTKDQIEILTNETQIVFHFAATLRLEAKLKDAIEMNTVGTKRVLELAREMKHLVCLVHLSTAFCHVDQKELGEKVYDAPDDPHDIMRLIQWMDESAIDLITPKLLGPHPNTYTYSKRLAEKLVADEYCNIPCGIARPSIVIPAHKEPLPGWVDNLNGPVGLIVAAGKGVLRSMHCNGDYHAEVIPVDLAINAVIAFAHKLGAAPKKMKNMPVINITQSGVLPITYGEIVSKGKLISREYPFEGSVWYPDGDIRKSKFIHNLFLFFFQLLPAYFIDFLMLIFRQKRFMVRIQKRIFDGLELLQYFTTREWIFHNTNFLILFDEMSPKDKKIFPIDLLAINMEDYMKDVLLGARQYCMKEKLETLPRARMHHRMLYIIHILTVYLFYFGVFYFIYKHFEMARYYLDYVSDGIKSLPVVGNIFGAIHL
ncbi:putative fatty acyl-CoA reductase CG5065 [Prorops nasuta]|uniref:putative fatty acyl-CoA reductase CG5065 n=1 Tax=Prorops nasuta TaxID=863751 RepID=UPI0034CFC46F